MPRALRVFQVDAFTTQPFCGNPAGVVLDADTLSGEAMQLIARELNNGDTAFVLRADGDDHDIRVRFFTPRTEVSFVGHASIAVHAVLARVLAAPAPRQKQRSGIVNVQVQGADTTLNVAIAQPPPRLQQAPPAAALAATLTALGLNSSELDQRAPPIIAGEASTRLLLALNEGSRLAQLQPDSAQLAALSPLVGAPGYFLYSLRPAVADCEVEARMFCPALGIAEDPVSGNAHGMLGAYLWQQALLPAAGAAHSAGFRGAQGHHMGRAGRLRIDVRTRDGQLDGVTINGNAVVIFETTISLLQ